MIIGFLGKGGSGKSTVSTLMTQYLQQLGKSVLAVDADHNMDLSYNLGYEGEGPFIGGSFLPLRNEFGLNDVEPTEGIFTGEKPEPRFLFEHGDDYSKKYVHKLSENLHLMMSGPQSDLVLYGSHCSHSLAAPLKIYLPLLKLQDNQAVVIDEKASVDAVSTGIPTGFDLAVVVTEPRKHGLRVAKQISEMLDWYNVPRVIILNKSKGVEDEKLFEETLGVKPFLTLPAHLDPLDADSSMHERLQPIVDHAKKILENGSQRLERTIDKYKRNETFQSST